VFGDKKLLHKNIYFGTYTRELPAPRGFFCFTNMAKEYSAEALKFYKSAKWQKCRKAFISERRAIDGGMCQRCHERIGYIVHHKIYLDAATLLNPAITLNPENLEFLCKYCHDFEHFVPEGKRLLCQFNEEGRPINATSEIGN